MILSHQWCFSLSPTSFISESNTNAFFFFKESEKGKHYLGVDAEDVALHFVHRVEAVRHSAQMEPLENHLVLGESS